VIASDPLLLLTGLTVRRRGQAILWDVSTRVARGSIHVIAGPNGGGKTTLVLAALGQIGFSGRIAARWRQGGMIGYLPQALMVDPTLPVTVADFLALTRQRRPICLGLGRAARVRVAELLERTGLPGVADRPLSVLSGGELRRILLAHALDPIPELLILDEPATGLDEAASRWLEQQTLLDVRDRHGVTVLMVSHDLAQARRIADRVTVLDRTVLADGEPSQALEQLAR
jgi:zinc transport system ATP-binding protein